MTAIPRISYADALKLGPKRFTEEYVFPAMLREHGRGFAMSVWNEDFNMDSNDFGDYDGLPRPAPSCKSVMCIGGTMEAITGLSMNANNTKKLAKLLGLNRYQTSSLFYEYLYKWSARNWSRFEKAKTPLQKVKVAIDEIKLAIRTKGKSLETR